MAALVIVLIAIGFFKLRALTPFGLGLLLMHVHGCCNSCQLQIEQNIILYSFQSVY
jgi:hypothetical protein